MKNLSITNCFLFVIAVALVVIAARPYIAPAVAAAQSGQTAAAPGTASDPLYIEPGTQAIRSLDGTSQVYGRMVVDLQSGTIWGFPTLTSAPYPVDISSSKPPVSHPIYLGRFAFEDITR
jgi:hypothetical protein